MTALPTIGGDRDTWGTKLVAWLRSFANADGTLKSAAVEAALGGSLPFNVVDYGAVLDDNTAATTNTTAFNAALTAAAAYATAHHGGAVVMIPAGRWYFDGLVTVPLYVDLVGAGKWATQLRATTADSQVRFGDGGGATATVNYGGRSGNFRIYGADITTCSLFVGASVGRSFEHIFLDHAGTDALRLEQTQNCAFIEVDAASAGGSGVVLDYGAGGNAFYKCEFDLNGYANGRSTYSGAVTGIGYAVVTHNLFSHCLFEGTTTTTVACFDHGAGTRLLFHSSHLTLLSGALGHAALYGTSIPVFRQWKENADAAARSETTHFDRTQVFGSAPVSGTAYKGIGLDILNAAGADGHRNVYLGQGCVISTVDTAIRADDTSVIEADKFTIETFTTRYAARGAGTATESVVVKHRGNAQQITGVDVAVPTLAIVEASGQTADAIVVFAADGTTKLFEVSSGGSIPIANTGTFTGTLAASLIKLTGRGAVNAPAFTFTNDLDCGM